MRHTGFRIFPAHDAWNTRDPETFATLTMPAPCDECPLRQRCADEKLACPAFVRFVRGSTAWGKAGREPSPELYRAIMREEYEGPVRKRRAAVDEVRERLLGVTVSGREVVAVERTAGGVEAYMRCPQCERVVKFHHSVVTRGEVPLCICRSRAHAFARAIDEVQPCAP